MRYTLSNQNLIVEVESFGAEIKSVRNAKTDYEYMWCGDKKYWGRTSPVLFPFVGSMKNKEFIVNGTHYPMGQHGFARDMEHTLVSQTETTIWFCLESSDETRVKYPFDFRLNIGYELTDNEIKVMWKVTNIGDELLPFSIGAHPAFNCPIKDDEAKEGYSLSFAIKKEGMFVPLSEIHHHGNTRDTGLAITEDLALKLDKGVCEITPGFFDRCTYMIEGNQANSVGIIDKNGHEYVTVLFDTPLFAIWSPEEKNAPFICIEPWYGRCDHVDFAGDIYARDYTHILASGELFTGTYSMIFN